MKLQHRVIAMFSKGKKENVKPRTDVLRFALQKDNPLDKRP